MAWCLGTTTGHLDPAGNGKKFVFTDDWLPEGYSGPEFRANVTQVIIWYVLCEF